MHPGKLSTITLSQLPSLFPPETIFSESRLLLPHFLIGGNFMITTVLHLTTIYSV